MTLRRQPAWLAPRYLTVAMLIAPLTLTLNRFNAVVGVGTVVFVITADRYKAGAPVIGVAKLVHSALDQVERIKDMVSELEGLYQAHGARAAVKLRRVA